MATLLSTKHLTKRFGGLVAVNQVDFAIEEGQVAGVIGPNGSGKTTLFNLISGFFPPSEGSVVFRGQEVSLAPPNTRVGMGMARTFQLVSVFNSLSVWENLVLSNLRFRKRHKSGFVGFYLRPARRERLLESCAESMEKVGLAGLLKTRTSELSYGDKRMLEIAIALSLKPKLLLLDEPLAGLSDHEIAQVIDLLHQVKKDFSLVIIEHKISKIVGLVERLSVMNEGRLICEGRPDDVLCNPDVRECYWGAEGKTC
ncbi:MAG: ABC transporter ATP-binding protein [Thermodesulfobacteriota bacterium]